MTRGLLCLQGCVGRYAPLLPRDSAERILTHQKHAWSLSFLLPPFSLNKCWSVPTHDFPEVLWPWHHDGWPHSAPQASGPSHHTPSSSQGTSSSAASSCQVLPLPLSLALKQLPAMSHPQAKTMLRVSVKALFSNLPPFQSSSDSLLSWSPHFH